MPAVGGVKGCPDIAGNSVASIGGWPGASGVKRLIGDKEVKRLTCVARIKWLPCVAAADGCIGAARIGWFSSVAGIKGLANIVGIRQLCTVAGVEGFTDIASGRLLLDVVGVERGPCVPRWCPAVTKAERFSDVVRVTVLGGVAGAGGISKVDRLDLFK